MQHFTGCGGEGRNRRLTRWKSINGWTLVCFHLVIDGENKYLNRAWIGFMRQRNFSSNSHNHSAGGPSPSSTHQSVSMCGISFIMRLFDWRNRVVGVENQCFLSSAHSVFLPLLTIHPIDSSAEDCVNAHLFPILWRKSAGGKIFSWAELLKLWLDLCGDRSTERCFGQVPSQVETAAAGWLERRMRRTTNTWVLGCPSVLGVGIMA